MVVLQLIVLLSLAFIFYQDMRYRAVYWFCFPVLAIFLGVLKFNHTSFSMFVTDVGYGVLFLILQLTLLSAYFSIKNRSLINITRSHLGWGDILFLIALTFYFSPINFVLFYVLSLITVLIFVIVKTVIGEVEGIRHIPLAGLQAALFGLLLVSQVFFKDMSFYDDQWFYFLIY